MDANKKVKFGTFQVVASLKFSEDLNLDHYFDQPEWDRMSVHDQHSWIQAHIESEAMIHLSINYKFSV